MNKDGFELGMAEEIAFWREAIAKHRDELLKKPLTQRGMGRMMALGNVDSLVWRLERRLSGDNGA